MAFVLYQIVTLCACGDGQCHGMGLAQPTQRCHSSEGPRRRRLLLLLLLLLPLCCCSLPPLPAPRLYIRSLSLTRARAGTCWAFSATENIESVWALAGNALTPLSG